MSEWSVVCLLCKLWGNNHTDYFLNETLCSGLMHSEGENGSPKSSKYNVVSLCLLTKERKGGNSSSIMTTQRWEFGLSTLTIVRKLTLVKSLNLSEFQPLLL
jgi:hypothetical protein